MPTLVGRSRFGRGLLTATAGLPLFSDTDGCSAYNSLNADGADGSVEWTNTNGALGSFLSGNVCTNFLSWSLSMTVTGSALQFGTVRTAGVAF